MAKIEAQMTDGRTIITTEQITRRRYFGTIDDDNKEHLQDLIDETIGDEVVVDAEGEAE